MGNLSLKSIAKKYYDRFGFRNRIIQSIPSENLGIIDHQSDDIFENTDFAALTDYLISSPLQCSVHTVSK